MAEVMLEIAGRSYTVGCRDGEEAHLLTLGQIVDGKARDAVRAMGNLTENRHLLVTALLLADSLKEAQKTSASPALSDDAGAEAIERIAERIEKLALTLEHGAASA